MANIRKTHEEFVKEMQIKNPDISIMGQYTTAKEKIKVKCKKCGYEWIVLPSNLLAGSGCPKCVKKKWGENNRLTQKCFLERVKGINANIIPLENYTLSRNKIKCKCIKCDKIFNITASYLLLEQKAKCPYCSKEQGRPNARLSHDNFIKRMGQIDKDIIIIGKYKDSRSKIKCKCKKCNGEWYSIANNLLAKKVGCPNCFISKGERAIQQFLLKENIKFVQQYKFNDCRDKNRLPFDFYLNEYNLCIEYDGEFHYMASGFCGGQNKLKYTQLHDEIKNKYCKNNNINLLRISYKDFANIENILQEKLYHEVLKGA